MVYLYGKNIDKSLPLAEAYAKAAVDSGADKAYTIFAKACFAQDKHSDGMAALREGMAKGDPGATYAYGLQLIAGKHCTKNRDEGLVTIMCAAELGCIPAANYIMTHDQAQFKEAATKAATGKVQAAPKGTTGGQIEREIDAYLNDKNRIAQKSM